MKNNMRAEMHEKVCRELSQEKLSSLKNAHRGKRCFILGNGPSLNRMDLSGLKDEFTFGTNRLYLNFPNMGFVPSFYICVDDLLIEQFSNDMGSINCTKFFDIAHVRPELSSSQTVYIEKNAAENKFFTDASEGYNGGGSATFVAMQLAYFMGFSQICLVGVDHSFVTTDGTGLPRGAVLNHFHPDYHSHGMRSYPPDRERMENSYQLAKGVCEFNGRVIIDTTPGGQLTIFPKVDFAEIFSSRQGISSQCREMPRHDVGPMPSSGIQPEYLVSAIVSTYNSERFIRDCLEDLLRQTIADRLEIVIINSCSQQNEEAIIYEFMARHANIVYLKTPTRETIYKAWNRGIRLARGKYITNANADDAHAPDAFEKMATVLDERPEVGLVYVDQKYYKETAGGGKEFWFDCDRGPFSWNRLLDECFASSQPMWRACVHDEFGYFDEIFFTAGDYEYWLRIAQKYTFHHLKETLGVRLIRDDSLEYDGNSFLSVLETVFLQKCYEYAALYSLPVGPEGLGGHPVFSNWCEMSMLKRNTIRKIGAANTGKKEQVFEWRRNNSRPHASVIITTFNRRQELLDNLASLEQQTYTDFEVIVVNNGDSIDELRDNSVLLGYGYCYVEASSNYGPSHARNLGAGLANGDIIAVLDDDAVADGNWLRNIVEHFKKDNIVALRGRVLLRSPKENGHVPLNYDLGNETVVSTVGLEMNTAFRKDAFLAAGGYDEFLFGYEGAELSFRLFRSCGMRIDAIKYFPDVLTYHDFPSRPERLTETVLRLKAMKKVLQRKSPGFERYLTFMWEMIPANQRWGDPRWLVDNALFCLNDNPADAVEFASAAVKLLPGEPLSYVVIGQAMGTLSRFSEAIPMYSQGLELLIAFKRTCDNSGQEFPASLLDMMKVADTGMRGCQEAVRRGFDPPSNVTRQVESPAQKRTRLLTASTNNMRRFQNLHNGKRCVIIGNGPSLKNMDLSFLENEICFGMNRIYLIFDKWKFRPTYYVSVNPLVIEQSAEDILDLPMPKFLSHKGINFFEDPKDIMFLAEHPEWEFSGSPYAGLHEGWTVTFVAMQLAYFMGFSEVVLIGVDHHFVTPGDPNKEVVSQGDDPNHFHPDYFGKGVRWHLPDLQRSEHSYHMAKAAFDNSGRRIIDATLDGKLTIFPKVDYQDYFSNTKLLPAELSHADISTLINLFTNNPSEELGLKLVAQLRGVNLHEDADIVQQAVQAMRNTIYVPGVVKCLSSPLL